MKFNLRSFRSFQFNKGLIFKFGLAALFILVLSLPVLAQGDAPQTTGLSSDAADVTGKTQMWLGVFTNVFLLIVAGQFLALLGKIFTIYELSNEANGKPKTINWNNINAGMFIFALVVFFSGVIWELAVHGQMLLPEAASLNGVVTDNLFMITVWIIGVVFFLTHILLFGYAFLYRHNKQKRAYFYPENNTLEQAWTIAPAIVLTILVVFGFFAWRKITSGEGVLGQKNMVTVELTGEQWKWWTRYPGKDGILGRKNYKLIGGANQLGVDFTDKHAEDDVIDKQGDTIVLPVNRPIKLVLGAKDVIHSAYMPYFRVQMNAVPGLPTYFYFTPTITTDEMRAKLGVDTFNYILLCAKICGNSHYNMGRIVRVVNDREYQQWLGKLKPWYSDSTHRASLKTAQNSSSIQFNKTLALSAK